MTLNQPKEWKQVSQKIAEEGIVLLRNDNRVLPISPEERVALFGGAQFDQKRAMDGSPASVDAIDLAQAFRQEGIQTDPELAEMYARWNETGAVQIRGGSNVHRFNPPEMPISRELAEAAAARGIRKAVVTLWRTGGENLDIAPEQGGFYLTDEEKNMLRILCDVFEQVVLILQISCMVDLSILDECKVDGILYTNQLGENGAVAAAKIITGAVNPSGKLTMTAARTYEDYPSSKSFGKYGGGVFQDYLEDIYVGYRYFENFAREKILFPFGFGLSYTSFDIGNITYAEDAGRITVTASVTNTGPVAGKEVVQLYYGAPGAADGAVLCAPPRQLCGFEKTQLLEPGMCQQLSFTLAVEDMASFDDLGVLGAPSSYVLERGDYRIYLGTSSRDVTLAGTHSEPEHRQIRQVHEIKTALSRRLNGYGGYDVLPEQEWDPNRNHAVYALGRTVFTTCQATTQDYTSFSQLRAGESISYRMKPGTGGEYFVRFTRNDTCVDPESLFEVIVNDKPVKAWNRQEDGSCIILLPQTVFRLHLRAKVDSPDVDSFSFEKRVRNTAIRSSGQNVVEAASLYDSYIGVRLENMENPKTGRQMTYVTEFFHAGAYASYQLEVEQEGDYDIQFLYRYTKESVPLSKMISVAVSNIVQLLSSETLEQNDTFELSPVSTIHLPAGTVYLKVISEKAWGLSFSEILLTRKETVRGSAQSQLFAPDKKIRNAPGQLGDLAFAEPQGMQLCEVYQDPERMGDFLAQMSHRELATVVSGIRLNATATGDVGCSHPLPQRGIPAGQTSDGPCGLRQFGCYPTSYPASMTLAASWNKELHELFGSAMAMECKSYNVDYWLAPGINILRNPLGGRNMSYYSEDPYLAGITASGVVRGVEQRGVVTVVKHYAANSTEFERLKSNSRVSARAIREIYIKAFEIAVKRSDPGAIMSSYNHINDVKVCEDRTMITEIPRDEWGWEGVFFTDWWNDSSHVLELKAGHDLKMATGEIDEVTAALDAGELSREQVEQCAARVLRMLFKLERVRKLLDRQIKSAV